MRPIPHPYRKIFSLSSHSNGVCGSLHHASPTLPLFALSFCTRTTRWPCQSLTLQPAICWSIANSTWNTLYANELGHLCQGISSGKAPSSKHVASTNTFFVINYHNIPLHKRKEICHTMVVCEVRPDKDDSNCTQITIGSNHICYPGDVGTNTALLELLKSPSQQ